MSEPEKKKSAGFGATSSALEAHAPVPTPPAPPLTLGAILFSLVIFGVPIGQAIYEKARGEGVHALEYFDPLTRGTEGRPAATWLKELALDVTSAPRLRQFEEELHEKLFLKREALPWYQWFVSTVFRGGNEKAVVGRDGWLFFADDLESAYGPGYLEPGLGGQEALEAISDFKAQLDARGVELLLIPSYSKEMLDPQMLSRLTEDLKSAVNPDLERFYDDLERRGLSFVRMDEIFAAVRAENAEKGGAPDTPIALPRDTHWLPSTMATSARRIAERAREILSESELEEPARFATRKVTVEGEGDLVRMLALPAGQTLYPPMWLELEQVVDAESGELVRSDQYSDVLLMGDSLTKVFSDPTLGLGEGAGLGEHLALHLNRPLDVIALAGGSASGTRESLARREDGLGGKRLVIWQFGVRMLASGPGEWRKIAMPAPVIELGGKPRPHVGAEVPRDKSTVVGEIVEVSSIPREFAYDFCLAVYEYKVLEVVGGAPKLEGDRIWVAHPAIVEGKDLPARTFKAGQRHRMTVDDLRLHYDLEVDAWWDETEAGRILYYPLSSEDAR